MKQNSFYIKSLGCKVNQCDAQHIRRVLSRQGWRESDSLKEADLCFVNTCCVTHQADRKSRNAIRQASRFKGKKAWLAVGGCYPAYDREAIAGISGVDVIFDHDTETALIKWLMGFKEGGASGRPVAGFEKRTRAFLKVQEGCDNHCAYCVVPLVRGRSRSKGLPEVMGEAKELVAAGHREIVVTGVCLGSYGRDLVGRVALADVIRALAELKSLQRIRLSSIEPLDITDRLLGEMARSAKLCPHLHIPFQSGDDRVLAEMNRRTSVKAYREIVDKARSKIRNLSISCDLIVGFPAEDERAFRNTCAFMEYVRPMRTHLFTFSPRRGTPACERGYCRIPAGRIKERFRHLKKLGDAFSDAHRRHFLNRDLPVLFEEERSSRWEGYTDNYIRVSVASRMPLRNVLLPVTLKRIDGERVWGDLPGP